MNKNNLLRCCLCGVLAILTETAVGNYQMPIMVPIQVTNQLANDSIEIEKATFMPRESFVVGIAPAGKSKIQRNAPATLIYYAPNSELSKATLSFAIKVPRANSNGGPGYCVLSLNFDNLQTNPSYTVFLSNRGNGYACSYIGQLNDGSVTSLQNLTVSVGGLNLDYLEIAITDTPIQ